MCILLVKIVRIIARNGNATRQKGKTMRPIDADAMIKWINGTECFMDVFKRVTTDIINKQPTVDAVPVQRKSVVGYEGLYEVDSLSRIFSKISGKQMKQWTTTRGYKSVSLTKNGKEKNVFVHRIVAEAFVPNRKGYPFVNHKDEDKTNNLPENLEWCTAKYNSNYGTAVKRRLETLKRNGTSTRGRPSEKQKQIVAVDENGNEFVFSNSYEAAEKTGADRRNIFACCQGKKKRLKGYKFDWFCADGEQ
jgi:hypothetical protein